MCNLLCFGQCTHCPYSKLTYINGISLRKTNKKLKYMTDIKCLEYDDEAAIIFIQKKLPKELNISDDDIQYVLDVIYDFYESKGLLNEDTDEEVEIVEEELLHYILKAVKKDEMDADKLTEENVQLILDAEYEYSESLGVY